MEEQCKEADEIIDQEIAELNRQIAQREDDRRRGREFAHSAIGLYTACQQFFAIYSKEDIDRWVHQGFLPPGPRQFIPAFEASRISLEIDRRGRPMGLLKFIIGSVTIEIAEKQV